MFFRSFYRIVYIMDKKIIFRKRYTVIFAAAMLTAAVALSALIPAIVSGGAKKTKTSSLPVTEYTGFFPGIPDCRGIFSTQTAGVSCHDLIAGPENSPWFTAAAAERSGNRLKITDLRFCNEDFAGLSGWCAAVTTQNSVKIISGSWQDDRGFTGTFEATDGRWEMTTPGSVIEFDAVQSKKQETFNTIAEISLPEYNGAFPYAPGKVTLSRNFSLPEMTLQETKLSTRDWDLYITGSGEWLMTRSVAGEIAEIPGIVFDRLTAAGSTGAEEIRWSANWISKSPLLQEETFLHAIAGNGIPCTFSATGTPGQPAAWRMTAEPSGNITVWGRMKMIVRECKLEGSGSTVAGTVRVSNVEIPLPQGNMLLKIPSAALEIGHDGRICGRAEQSSSVFSRNTGTSFTLENLVWIQQSDEIEELHGSSGTGNGFSWLDFKIMPSAGSGIFKEFTAELPGCRAVTSHLSFTTTESAGDLQYNVVFGDCNSTSKDICVVSTGGSMTVEADGSISGNAVQCTITSPLYPDCMIRGATAEFSLPGSKHEGEITCRITGRVYDCHGLLANLEAEHNRDINQWRGKCTFLTTGNMSAIVLYSPESHGWIIPLAGSSSENFPESLFPGWRGVHLSGIGSFEYDNRDGSRINMINASCSAGGVSFTDARGQWQLTTPGSPGSNDLLTLSFCGTNIPGGSAGEFAGVFVNRELHPMSLAFDFLCGKCEFIGVMDKMWLVNFSGISGKALAEGFFGTDHGTGWDNFIFSGSGVYSPAAASWESLSLSGLPSGNAAEIRTSIPGAVANILPDASSDFFKAFLNDCFISAFTVEYSRDSDTVATGVTARPAAPLNFIFSGDPDAPFTTPEAGEPGFSGTIEAGIHLPLNNSGGILIK